MIFKLRRHKIFPSAVNYFYFSSTDFNQTENKLECTLIYITLQRKFPNSFKSSLTL